jgi:hypothetical protein
MIDAPPGMVVIPLGKACVLVLPERVYLAGLKLGKALRRRQAEASRAAKASDDPDLSPETGG